MSILIIILRIVESERFLRIPLYFSIRFCLMLADFTDLPLQISITYLVVTLHELF